MVLTKPRGHPVGPTTPTTPLQFTLHFVDENGLLSNAFRISFKRNSGYAQDE